MAALSTCRTIFGVAAATVSFVIYAWIVTTLPQALDNGYGPERSSVAAAASNVVFGTPFLTVDTAVLDYYLKSLESPLQSVLDDTEAAAARSGGKPPGSVQKTIRDGNGVGYALLVTAAFRLFGLHVWALLAMMLILMAASAAAFLARFRGPFVLVVVLYFSSLTLMLFTPLVWDYSYAIQIAVGGIRYFSVVTLLPAFHILLDLLDLQPAPQRRRGARLTLLGAQALILVVAALVRGSAIPLVGVIAVVWLALLCKQRRDRAMVRDLIAKATVMSTAAILFLVVVIVAMPRDYLREGRFQPQIWHRVTESLGVDPEFPWPGVAEMFDCKRYIAAGIQEGFPDSNGHCIWLAYAMRHNIPISAAVTMTYGGTYEVALREAFFAIFRKYPGKVLATFLLDKPPWIVRSLADSLRTNFDADPARTIDDQVHYPQPVVPYSPTVLDLLLGALANLLIYLLISITQFSAPAARRVGAAAAILALSTLPAYIAVWALPYSTADLLFFCFFFLGLALWLAPQAARWLVSRHVLPSPHPSSPG